MPPLLFELGYLLGEAGQGDLARRAFRRLIDDYPGSRFVPLIYAVVGDRFVAKHEPPFAMSAALFMLDCLKTLGRHDEYTAWIDKLLAAP